MQVDTLDKLKSDFDKWRSKKKYIREVVPDALMNRARRAVSVHGIQGVVRATKINRSRLTRDQTPEVMNDKMQDAMVPSYSQMDLVVSKVKKSPVAELETPMGLKLRIFTPTQEMLELVSSVCRNGGAQ